MSNAGSGAVVNKSGIRRYWQRVALVTGLLGAVFGCQRPPAAPKHSPVVLVVIDTLRADYLGSYGFQGEVSPEIDRLAKESLVFERCSAGSPWTKPSVATLFTSTYPEIHHVLTEHGLFRNRAPSARTTETDVLEDSFQTLAEVLRDGGYVSTAFVGNPWISSEMGYAQGFSDFHGDSNTPVPQGELKRPSGSLLEGVRNFLAARAAEPQRPFFLYLHLMDVHGPYDADEADVQAVKDSPSLGPSIPMGPAEMRRVPPYLRGPQWTSDPANADVRIWRAHYAAGVRSADRQIGALRRALEESGFLDRTLLIVTSDHGEQLYDHKSWDHGYSLLEHQLHVPLVMRLPGHSQARRIPSLVSLIDVPTTVVGLVGGKRPTEWQGRDLSAALQAGDTPPSANCFASAAKWRPKLASMRTDRYKLIVGGESKRVQLYDLEKDPEEKQNLAEREADIVHELEAQLSQHRSSMGEKPLRVGSPVPLSGAARERLRNLGYLEDQ